MFLLCAGRQQSDGLIFHTADDVPADAAVPQGSGNGHAGAAREPWDNGADPRRFCQSGCRAGRWVLRGTLAPEGLAASPQPRTDPQPTCGADNSDKVSGMAEAVERQRRGAAR